VGEVLGGLLDRVGDDIVLRKPQSGSYVEKCIEMLHAYVYFGVNHYFGVLGHHMEKDASGAVQDAQTVGSGWDLRRFVREHAQDDGVPHPRQQQHRYRNGLDLPTPGSQCDVHI
jgi:hypothetical protein